jgi:small-conductance mechanosensitive channel
MFQNLYDFIQLQASSLLLAVIVVLIIFIAYKIILRFINQTVDRLELEPHIRNVIKLILRVIALLVSLLSVFTIFNLPTDFFIGGSALLGAALGFGSSQTINNIVAGFYVLVSQPFKVKDYVIIGDLEGQVEEISINYTNLYTPTFNLLKVPNTQVMNSRILNLTHEGFIKYTFTISFDHVLSQDIIFNEIISPAIEDFHKRYEEEVRRPEAYMDKANRLEKIFLIRIFIPKGEAKQLHILQPELLKLIMQKYDEVKIR